ncbi:MAG: GGDEF domain-containing protein [Chromatiales bacterium]|nr:GGDEF domain-containing protein [Chromatiales bacterium]
MESQQGSESGATGRWLYRPDGEPSRARLAVAVVGAALAAAMLVGLLGSVTGLAGGWALLLTALAAAVLIHVAILMPLVNDLSRRLGSVEYEIADTVQRLRVAKAAQPASALTDEVTLLPSRRVVTSSILEHMAHAERYGNPLSVAYVELNDFERLHSEFGTGVTDQALKTVADAFADTLRMPDKAGRCDGHTFLVVLPHTTLKDANAIAERLRRNVSGRSVHHAGHDLKLAVAIGATQFRKGDDLEKLLERAQEAVHARPAAARKREGGTTRQGTVTGPRLSG